MVNYIKKSWWKVNSRIFLRIAAGLFASILIIEIALLLYSWFTERDRLLDRLEETLTTISSSLDAANPTQQLETLLSNEGKFSKFPITAFIHITASGKRTSGGNFSQIDQLVTLQNPTLFNSSNGDYIQLIPRYTDKEDQLGQNLWLRVDASSINLYMKTYVVRILAMVILISIFVTIACLILLKPVLINPLLRLDRLLVRGQTQGIRNANAEPTDLNRADELGSVFRSFNLLRNQLVEAEVHSTTITDRLEEFATMGADCFWETDNKYAFTYVSGDVQTVLGISPNKVQDQTLRKLISNLQNRTPKINSIYNSLAEHGIWEGKILPLTDGEPSISLRVSSTPLRTSAGYIKGFRGTIKDISKETELAEKLYYQATHDELTRLCNRREFSAQLQASIDKYTKDGTIFSLLTLDLDHFKNINDSAGHAAGDALLKCLAQILTEATAPEDIVARLGGDEFCVLIRSTDAKGAEAIAEKIRRSIENNNFVWGKQSYTTTASIGLVVITDEIATSEGIAIAADTCCITAKQTGKNQLKIFGQDDVTGFALQGESEWITLILSALKSDGFSLFRQSIVRIDQSKEEHFEILLRMHNSEGGFHSPIDFLPIAERNQLMPRIDKWVVENALEWLAVQVIPATSNYCMNINLSAASLSDVDFREFLLKRVSINTELNKFLCFEVTESAAMGNLENTIQLLAVLREHGCRIALDDFGTGFSSLSHIRELPLDYIKIDGSFIKEIGSNALDQAVVKSVAEIAKVLCIKTVAEFVDSNEALSILEKLDIDYAQGFLFSKPEQLKNTPEILNLNKAA